MVHGGSQFIPRWLGSPMGLWDKPEHEQILQVMEAHGKQPRCLAGAACLFLRCFLGMRENFKVLHVMS